MQKISTMRANGKKILKGKDLAEEGAGDCIAALFLRAG